ncbi:hypothetical protein [Laspinema olomoucense]|uniref:hypothetical protein n=1 Tax=Laspinema olomoucense TaxID=3231600 RepID=UPI0021BBAAA1|nr:hypothetical protein [Laspinema sp. D3d]MCT7974609.1 hypothetical protein [Laspinema sp. D3d]
MPKLKERSPGVQQNKTIHAKPGIQTGPAQILSHACQKATWAWKLGNNIDARK